MDFDNNLSTVEPNKKWAVFIIFCQVWCYVQHWNHANGKFSGNLWVQQRQKRNEHFKWICDLCCLAICIYLYSTLHSLPVTIGNFSNNLLTFNGVESHCNANGVLVHLYTKYTLMELNCMNTTGGKIKYQESLKWRVMVFDNNFIFRRWISSELCF